jgi:hypothetical protein
MTANHSTKNLSEQISQARESGLVWGSSKGAKDCIICVLLVFVGQVIDSIQFVSVSQNLWSLTSINASELFAQNSLLNNVFISLLVSTLGFGLLILLLVLIQTKGFISFIGLNNAKSYNSDTLVIESIRTICAAVYLFLVCKEVLPKACILIFQPDSKLEYVPLFKAILSRSALFFLFTGVAQIFFERKTFIASLALPKATD